jgi:Nucleoside 2-deoxyribosyltransferase like
MARLIKPPAPLGLRHGSVVFLAGSIEMGAAEDWQAEFASLLADEDVTILNPRRDDWDSSWEQSVTNPTFRQQVEWELSGLDRADIIVMYLDPATKSPVSLLELGLHARGGKLVVCCPDGFWRKGNVDVVCERYGIARVESLPDLVERVRSRLPEAPDGNV